MVRETAAALHGLRIEPAGLVVAGRRIVERHPTSGPLWWFCSSVLTAPRPFEVMYDLAAEVEEDPTPDHLVDLLPDDATVCIVGWPDLIGDALLRRGDVRVLAIDSGDEGRAFVRRLQHADAEAEIVPARGASAAVLAADVVLVEALATGTGDVLVEAGSRAVASVGYCSEVPVWLAAGRGRRLTDPMFTTMLERLAEHRDPWDSPAEVMPVALCSQVVGPTGAVDLGPAVLAAECSTAFELLRPCPM